MKFNFERNISASSSEKTQQHTTDFPEISPLHMELVWFGLVFLFAMGKLKKWPEPVYVCI